MTETEKKIVEDMYVSGKREKDVRKSRIGYDEDPSSKFSGESVRRNVEDASMENQRRGV